MILTVVNILNGFTISKKHSYTNVMHFLRKFHYGNYHFVSNITFIYVFDSKLFKYCYVHGVKIIQRGSVPSFFFPFLWS